MLCSLVNRRQFHQPSQPVLGYGPSVMEGLNRILGVGKPYGPAPLFIGRDMIFNASKHKDDFENEEDAIQYVFELAMVAASFDKEPEDLTDIDIARARKKMKKYGIDLSVDLWK